MYFPQVDPVKIDQLDLGDIQKTNMQNALLQSKLEANQYETQSQNALNDFMKTNPDASAGQVQNFLAQAGYGSSAPDVVSKMNNNALLKATLLDKANKYAQSMVPMVRQAIKNGQDPQTVWNNGIAGFTTYTGIPVDPRMQQFDPSYLDAIEQGGIPALNRVILDRQDAALKSQGLAPGQDVSTLSTLSSMKNAADADSRAAQKFPLEMQRDQAGLEHTNLSNDALRQSMEAEQKVLVGPGGIRMRPDDAYSMFQKSAYYNPDMTFTDFLRQGQFKIGTYNPKTKALSLDEGQPFGADGATPPQGGGQPPMGGAPQGGGQPAANPGFGSGSGFGGMAPQPGGSAPAPAQQPGNGGTPGASAASQGASTGAFVQKGNGQALTSAMAAQYAKLAGGNRSKAEWMAKYDGWTW